MREMQREGFGRDPERASAEKGGVSEEREGGREAKGREGNGRKGGEGRGTDAAASKTFPGRLRSWLPSYSLRRKAFTIAYLANRPVLLRPRKRASATPSHSESTRQNPEPK